VGGLLQSAIARTLSDFAYVKPGPVPELKHKVRWRDAERYEAWKTDTIPFVDPLPEAKEAGQSDADFFKASWGAAQVELAKAGNKSAELFMVHALMALLEQRGVGEVLPAEERAKLLAPPTAEERAALDTADKRRDVAYALHDEVGALTVALQERTNEALDSGEVDLGVPLTEEQRESLQILRNRDLLAAALRIVRRMSMLTQALEGQLTPAARHELEGITEAWQAPELPMFGVDEGTGYLDADGIPALERRRGADGELTREEADNAYHGESYEEYKLRMLRVRDRTELLPRKRLPPPLQLGAPSLQLENAARLLDENPSMGSASKRRVLELYADALSGREKAAFDAKAELKAFVEPQPRWGTYDPQQVAMADDLLDAARGAGKFSAEKGFTYGEERIAPGRVGEGEVDASRAPNLTASEEVRALMARYDATEAARRADAQRAARAVLHSTTGVRDPAALLAGKPQPAAPAGAAAAAAGGATAGKLPKGVSVPAGMAEAEAARVVSTFFSRYMAGERTPPPQPPLRDESKVVLPKAPEKAAPAKAAAGKGKGKK
jgi:hypothetical protein